MQQGRGRSTSTSSARVQRRCTLLYSCGNCYHESFRPTNPSDGNRCLMITRGLMIKGFKQDENTCRCKMYINEYKEHQRVRCRCKLAAEQDKNETPLFFCARIPHKTKKLNTPFPLARVQSTYLNHQIECHIKNLCWDFG